LVDSFTFKASTTVLVINKLFSSRTWRFCTT